MIEVIGLTRYYGSFPAVRDVQFNIGKNSIVGFLGLNGAGKSTVLKMLGGLIPPSAGTIKISGVDVLNASDDFKNQIGYLPEEPPLYKEMRVDDFLIWCGELKGMSRADAEKRLEHVIKVCQLEPKRTHIIDTLSHGYKKRVGIAQAIIHDPKLVILDEPISGLDPVQIVDMREVLRNLKGSCTVLVSSHILTEISQICDRILVLNDGMIVADGTEADLQTAFGGQAYKLKLNIEGLEAPKKLLTDIAAREAFVKSFEIKSKTATEAKVEVLMDADEPEKLVETLIQSGFGIRGLSAGASELERIFVSVVEGAANEPDKLEWTDKKTSEEEE